MARTVLFDGLLPADLADPWFAALQEPLGEDPVASLARFVNEVANVANPLHGGVVDIKSYSLLTPGDRAATAAPRKGRAAMVIALGAAREHRVAEEKHGMRHGSVLWIKGGRHVVEPGPGPAVVVVASVKTN
jgi:hypothetical protein